VKVFEEIERHGTDQEICTALFSLLNNQVVTPQTVDNKSGNDTPLWSNSSSQRADEQKHDDLDDRIRQEIDGCVYQETEGFYEKYFEGKWPKKIQRIVRSINPQVVSGRWIGYPEPPTEGAFLDWFCALQKRCFPNKQRTYHSSARVPLKGSKCKRKPDIFLAHFDAADEEERYNWVDVQVIGELKQTKIRRMETEELVRFCGHAREVFASQPTRRFLHGFIIRASLMELWVFDRSGLYSSEQFDIHQDPHRFLTIMVGYTLMSDEELGLDTYIKTDKIGKYIEPKQDGGKVYERLYLEDKPIASQRAIIYRGTACYRAKRKKVKHWEHVVKFAWRSSLRRAEGDILQLAKQRGVWGIADLSYHYDLEEIASLREGLQFRKPKAFRSVKRDSISQSESRRSSLLSNAPGTSLVTVGSSHGQKRKRRDEMPPPSPPKRLRSGRHRQSNPTTPKAQTNDSTYIEPIYNSTGMESRSEGMFDNRIFSCLVISPPGRSIRDFKSVKELLEAFCDFIRAHQSLYVDGQILHRDISINNVIITEPERKGDPRGRLIDLDLGKERDGDPSRARRRTGTMEFMAIEVLEGKPHTYRHDLESLFYVFLWVIISHGLTHVPSTSHLRKWYRGSYADIADAKSVRMEKRGFTVILDEFLPEFEGLKGLARRIRDILFPYVDGLFTGTYQDPDKLYQPMIEAFEKEIVEFST